MIRSIFGAVQSSAPRIAIEAIAGDDGQIVTPHHCRQALSTDDADPPAGLTLQR